MERTASIRSATILAFPVGGRRGERDWGAQAVERSAPQAVVDCDAWYHQSAMDEPKPQGNA